MSRDADIARAAAILREGKLVAVPTETVYGLAGDARNDRAAAAIFAAKGRPSFNPLIAHVASREAAGRYAEFPPLADDLAAAFWPGPLTLVLPRRADCALSLLISAGLATIALRVPAHPVMRALLAEFGGPLAAPSANPSGAISPTSADHVREGFGEQAPFILDGGPSRIGVESTIVKVDANGATLLRAGGLARADIERIAGPLRASAGGVEAPGMMTSHYAPRARLRIGSTPRADEAFLAFGAAPAHAFSLNLSRSGDLIEAAANFFAHLHALDAMARDNKLAGIVAAPVPNSGLGEAINDRLARAAAPRQ